MSAALILIGLALLYLWYDNKKRGSNSTLSKLRKKVDDSI